MKIPADKRLKYLIPLLPYTAVFLPLWQKGYIVSLDMTFGPRTFPIVPMLMQHLIFALIFIGGMLAMQLLIREVMKQDKVRHWTAAAGGLFYLYNPFVYQRFLAGHWKFLVGYAALPLFIYLLIRLLQEHNPKLLAGAFALFVTTSWFTGHYLFIMGIPVALFIGVQIVRYLRHEIDGRTLFSLLLGWVGSLILLTVVMTLDHGDKVGSITLDHFYAYAGTPDMEHGMLYNFGILHGFWREGREMLLIKDLLVWPVILIGLTVLVLSGLIEGIRKQRKAISFLVVGGLMAFVFSLGVSHHTYRLTQFLVERIPGYAGMRDAQKFLALVALMYGVLLAMGLGFLYDLIQTKAKQAKLLSMALAGVTFCLLAANSWHMWWGLGGQVESISYPESWTQAAEYLEAEDPDAVILELPFYLYHRYPFVDRYSASAADSVFSNQIISSQNAHMGTDEHEADSLRSGIEVCFEDQDIDCLKQIMQDNSVGYILYNHERLTNLDFTDLTTDEQITVVVEDNQAALLKFQK